MLDMNRLAALGLALAVVPAAAGAQGNRCTKETLPVRGTAVTISYCVTGSPSKAAGSELLVPVTASYASSGGAFSESPTLHFIAAEGPSRVIEDVDLSKLGTAGTLHLTLVYKSGAVSIESAMLTPGAVTIK